MFPSSLARFGTLLLVLLLGACSDSGSSKPTSYLLFVDAGASAGGDGSLEAPYATISQALTNLAGYRADGGELPAVIEVAAGTYTEQVAIEAGSHDNLVLRGATEWTLDAEGRLNDVAANETRVEFATTAGFPDNYVIWLTADDVTIEDLVVQAAPGFPPSPPVAVTVDQVSGGVLRRVWAGNAFIAIHARASELLLDRTLTTGDFVGTTVEGGPGAGSSYTLNLCASRATGNAYQFVAHGSQETPRAPTPAWSGSERCEVSATNLLADGQGRGFQILAHLPASNGDYPTRGEAEGELVVDLVDSVAMNNDMGLRFLPDNFGYTNFPPNGDAAASTLDLTIEGTALGDNNFPFVADGAGAPYLTVRITDPDGSANGIYDTNGTMNWVAPSSVTYNGEQLAP